jgi:hypothetical protein
LGPRSLGSRPRGYDLSRCLNRSLVSPYRFSDPSSTFSRCRSVDRRRWSSRSFQQAPVQQGAGCTRNSHPQSYALHGVRPSDSRREQMNACLAAPLLRFAAPSAQSIQRVHLTRACLTRYVPPTGFHTLLTAYSSLDYPALFHAGALLEFLVPSELSPRPEPERLSASRCPLAVHSIPATVTPPGGGVAAVIAVRAANTSQPRDVTTRPTTARDDVAGR